MIDLKNNLRWLVKTCDENLSIKLNLSLILLLIITLFLGISSLAFDTPFVNPTSNFLVPEILLLLLFLMLAITAIVCIISSIYSINITKKADWNKVEPLFAIFKNLFATVKIIDWMLLLFSVIILLKFPYSFAISAMLIVFFRMMRPDILPKVIKPYSRRWWSNWVFFYGLLLLWIPFTEAPATLEIDFIGLLFLLAVFNEIVKNAFIKSDFSKVWVAFFTNIAKNHLPQNVLLYGRQEGLFFELKYAFFFLKRLDLVYRQGAFIIIGNPSIKAIDDWQENMVIAGPNNVDNAFKEIAKMKDFYEVDNFTTFEKIIEISKDIDLQISSDPINAKKRRDFIRYKWLTNKIYSSFYNALLDKLVFIIVALAIFIILYMLTGHFQIDQLQQLLTAHLI